MISWSQFTIYLAVAYVVYYALNIMIDLLKPQRQLASADQGGEELAFTEIEETKVIEQIKGSDTSSEIVIQQKKIAPETIKEKAMEQQAIFEFTEYYHGKAEGGAQDLTHLLQMAQANSIEMKKTLIL